MLNRRTPKDPRLEVLDLSDAEARTVSRHASIVRTGPGRELFAEGVHRPQLVWLLSGRSALSVQEWRIVADEAPDLADRLYALAQRRLAA